MKRILFLLLFLPAFTKGQIIITVAGAGSCTGGSGYCGDGGPATAAKASLPSSGSFDASGNYYFCHDGAAPHVRKVNTAGIITTVAGNGTQGYSGDGGPATDAQIRFGWTTVDSMGNLYISDNNACRIRKVDALTGIIHTICGNGSATTTGDGGPATAATIVPFGICCDKHGNLFICANGYIRKIDAAGIITTIAGNGLGGFTGDGGPATAAGIVTYSICMDTSENLYIGGAIRIRKIDMVSGIITHFAGNGSVPYSGDGIAATNAQFREIGIVMDREMNMYLADDVNDRIRMIDPSGIIHTIAGTGTAAFGGDGGPATAADLWNPEGVAIDRCGNLYIADDANNRIRKVLFYPACDSSFHSLNSTEIESTPDLSIYPNPTNDLLQINNLKSESVYTILTPIGKSIQQGTLNPGNNTLSIQSLPHGIYLLQLLNEQGERTTTKILKQ